MSSNSQEVNVELFVHENPGQARRKAWCIFQDHNGDWVSRYGRWPSSDPGISSLPQQSRLKKVVDGHDARNLECEKIDKGYRARGRYLINPKTGAIRKANSATAQAEPAQATQPTAAPAPVDSARASRLQGQRNPRVMRLPT